MKCPRDKTDLDQEIEVEGVMVDICPYCDGIWLDYEELSRITNMQSDLLEGPPVTEKLKWDEIIKCPLCEEGVPMVKRYFSKLKDIKVDKCPECKGLWLDTGELRAIIEFTGKLKEL